MKINKILIFFLSLNLIFASFYPVLTYGRVIEGTGEEDNSSQQEEQPVPPPAEEHTAAPEETPAFSDDTLSYPQAKIQLPDTKPEPPAPPPPSGHSSANEAKDAGTGSEEPATVPPAVKPTAQPAAVPSPTPLQSAAPLPTPMPLQQAPVPVTSFTPQASFQPVFDQENLRQEHLSLIADAHSQQKAIEQERERQEEIIKKNEQDLAAAREANETANLELVHKLNSTVSDAGEGVVEFNRQTASTITQTVTNLYQAPVNTAYKILEDRQKRNLDNEVYQQEEKVKLEENAQRQSIEVALNAPPATKALMLKKAFNLPESTSNEVVMQTAEEAMTKMGVKFGKDINDFTVTVPNPDNLPAVTFGTSVGSDTVTSNFPLPAASSNSDWSINFNLDFLKTQKEKDLEKTSKEQGCQNPNGCVSAQLSLEQQIKHAFGDGNQLDTTGEYTLAGKLIENNPKTFYTADFQAELVRILGPDEAARVSDAMSKRAPMMDQARAGLNFWESVPKIQQPTEEQIAAANNTAFNSAVQQAVYQQQLADYKNNTAGNPLVEVIVNGMNLVIPLSELSNYVNAKNDLERQDAFAGIMVAGVLQFATGGTGRTAEKAGATALKAAEKTGEKVTRDLAASAAKSAESGVAKGAEKGFLDNVGEFFGGLNPFKKAEQQTTNVVDQAGSTVEKTVADVQVALSPVDDAATAAKSAANDVAKKVESGVDVPAETKAAANDLKAQADNLIETKTEVDDAVQSAAAGDTGAAVATLKEAEGKLAQAEGEIVDIAKSDNSLAGAASNLRDSAIKADDAITDVRATLNQKTDGTTLFSKEAGDPVIDTQISQIQSKLEAGGTHVTPNIEQTFTDPALYHALPDSVRTESNLTEVIDNTQRYYDLVSKERLKANSPLFGEEVTIPQSAKADGGLRDIQTGRKINVDYVEQQGIDPEKVFFFRRTQPSTQPKPEYFWSSDHAEVTRGLTVEIPVAAREKSVVLVADLKTISTNGGLIEDINDIGAVRQIGLEPFDQGKAIARYQSGVNQVTKTTNQGGLIDKVKNWVSGEQGSVNLEPVRDTGQKIYDATLGRIFGKRTIKNEGEAFVSNETTLTQALDKGDSIYVGTVVGKVETAEQRTGQIAPDWFKPYKDMYEKVGIMGEDASYDQKLEVAMTEVLKQLQGESNITDQMIIDAFKQNGFYPREREIGIIKLELNPLSKEIGQRLSEQKVPGSEDILYDYAGKIADMADQQLKRDAQYEQLAKEWGAVYVPATEAQRAEAYIRNIGDKDLASNYGYSTVVSDSYFLPQRFVIKAPAEATQEETVRLYRGVAHFSPDVIQTSTLVRGGADAESVADFVSGKITMKELMNNPSVSDSVKGYAEMFAEGINRYEGIYPYDQWLDKPITEYNNWESRLYFTQKGSFGEAFGPWVSTTTDSGLANGFSVRGNWSGKGPSGTLILDVPKSKTKFFYDTSYENEVGVIAQIEPEWIKGFVPSQSGKVFNSSLKEAEDMIASLKPGDVVIPSQIEKAKAEVVEELAKTGQNVSAPKPQSFLPFSLITEVFAADSNPAQPVYIDSDQFDQLVKKQIIKDILVTDGKITSQTVQAIMKLDITKPESKEADDGYIFSTGKVGTAEGEVKGGRYRVSIDSLPGVDIEAPQSVTVGKNGFILIPIKVSKGSGQIKKGSAIGESGRGLIGTIYADEVKKAETGRVKVVVVSDKDQVLPWAGVQVKLEKVDTERKISLLAGWNLVTLTALPESPLTASGFLNEINKQGGESTTVSTLVDGAWKTYVKRGDKDFSGEDFPIEIGKAYFVKALQKSTFVFIGQTLAAPVKLKLASGWNAVGLPFMSKDYKASDLTGATSADTTARWESGLWDTFVVREKQQYGEDFNIVNNRGYLLKVEEEGEFAP